MLPGPRSLSGRFVLDNPRHKRKVRNCARFKKFPPTDVPISVTPCSSSAIYFFTKHSNNHCTLMVLFYIFDIPYHDSNALPFVAAGSQNGDNLRFGPKF